MDLAPQFSMPMQMPTVNQPMMAQPQMPQPQQTMEQRLGSLEEKFSGLTNRLDKLGSLQTGVFNQENTQQPSFYGNYPQMYLPKEDQKNQLAHDIATMAEKHAHESNMAQVDVNKAEAQHRSIFVAGWRPFIGWVCGVALAYHFILYPIVVFILASFPTETFTIDQLPKFDMDSLMTVLLGMLGLGGLRTFEKSKGLTK